jgi:hypothetical protein
MEYLRNEDIIKFNKYKAYFDLQIRKIDIDKEVAIQRYETQAGITLDDIANRKNNVNKYNTVRKLKEYLLNKMSNKNDDTNIISD